MNIESACRICEKKMSIEDKIFICSTCRLDTVNNRLFTKANQFSFLLSLGHKPKEIQEKDSKLFHFYRTKKMRGFLNPLFLFKEKPESLEKRLMSRYLSRKTSNMDEELGKYFKTKYGTWKSYSRHHGFVIDRQNWKQEFLKIYSIYGRDITIGLIQELNPELWKYISKKKKMGINELCRSLGIEDKKWEEWNVERIISLSMKYIKKNPNGFSIYRMVQIYGEGFFRAVKKYFGKDQIKFVETIKRNYKREQLRKNGICIEDHINLVRSVINKKFSKYLNNEYLYEEAVSAGTEGLLKAAGLYNESRGAWSTYAWQWIVAGIRRHFENFDPESVIRLPSHMQYNPEFNKSSIQTHSLNAIIDGEDGATEKQDLLDSGVSVDDSMFLSELREHLLKKFGEKTTSSFFDFFLHGKKFKSKTHTIEEVQDFVRKQFYS